MKKKLFISRKYSDLDTSFKRLPVHTNSQRPLVKKKTFKNKGKSYVIYMKRKEKRQAFSLKCPNCLIESGLADIQPKIPRLYRERARVRARGPRGHNFFFRRAHPVPF